MSDQEWCAHGPALNCKDCRIEELERDYAEAQHQIGEYVDKTAELQAQINRLSVSGTKDLPSRLRTEPFMHWELRHEAADRIEELEAENERLRAVVDAAKTMDKTAIAVALAALEDSDECE